MPALKWVKNEIIHAIPAILFFFIAFNLVHLTEGLMLRPGDMRFTNALGATIGAIIMGKIIIIVNTFRFINAFPNQPLIYNITWKFIIYSFFIILFQLIDYFIHQSYHHGSLSIGFHNLIAELKLPLFWGVQIWVLMSFLIYIIFSEFARVLGQEKVKQLLLG